MRDQAETTRYYRAIIQYENREVIAGPYIGGPGGGQAKARVTQAKKHKSVVDAWVEYTDVQWRPLKKT